MQKLYISDQTFERKEIQTKGDYENCVFIGCTFIDNNLSGYNFIQCTFKSCDLSNSNVDKTAFREVKFIECKLLGLRFDVCNSLGLSFNYENCLLNHSSFYKLKIKKTIFKNCILEEADFAQAELTDAVFENCDLINAVFDQTNIENGDFRTAYHYILDPEKNKIKNAKFSNSGLSGLLAKYGIVIEN